MVENRNELECLFGEICDGFSTFEITINDSLSTCYYKHPSYSNLFNLEKQVDKFKIEGGKSLLTWDESLKLIINKGWWPLEKQALLERTENFAARLKDTISKIAIRAQQYDMPKQLEDSEQLIERLSKERDEIMPRTLESYVNKKMNDFSIINYFFINSDFHTPLFENEEDYFELSNLEMANVQMEYFTTLNKLSFESIRKLSCGGFFQNSLRISGDIVQNFFGIPTSKLTKYQYDLFSSGIHFKTLFSNCAQMERPFPANHIGDPDKMEKWHEMQLNMWNNKNKKDNQSNTRYSMGGEGRMGATPEEIKAIYGDEASSGGLLQTARESGGKINMRDLMIKKGM